MARMIWHKGALCMSSPSAANNRLQKDRFLPLLEAIANKRVLPAIFGSLAVICAVLTYAQLTAENASAQSVIIFGSLAVLSLLCAVIARPVTSLIRAHKIGLAGSRLRNRLVQMFALIAIVPTFFVALSTALFLEVGLENWFSAEIRNTVDNSVSMAEDYYEEHRKSLQRDMAEAAGALNRKAPYLQLNRDAMMNEVMDLAFLHSMNEVVIMSGTGEVFARYNFAGAGDANISRLETLPTRAFEEAKPGIVVPIHSDQDDVVQVFMKLSSFLDRYMFASRTIAPAVVEKLESTRKHAGQFALLEEERATIQFQFTLIFLGIALVLLMAAIWSGLRLANQIVAPIGRLVDAADQITEGNLGVRVEEPTQDDEVSVLSRAFNTMTGQLESQRKDLTDTNRELDQRNRFTEAVLGGVSVGVIGLNRDLAIDLPNKRALSILDITEDDDYIGKKLVDLVPELEDIVEKAIDAPEQFIQEQINITRQGIIKSLQVRVTTEHAGDRIVGYVVTIDDITKLVSAERTAAWADVARRIAHEIKNPLTPIQLSAERLNRKYLGEVSSDPDVFSRCTETIIRQVGDIRRMVDEFSGFARMPAPTFARENITELAHQTLLFLEVSSPNLAFDLECPEAPVFLPCDGRLLAQALTNIVKNAVESIEGKKEKEEAPSQAGRVVVRIIENDMTVVISVSDNGAGIPNELSDRLTEPYVTTRSKGTGLGLAIVHKIMADHGGELTLENVNDGGACVSLTFNMPRLQTLYESALQKQSSPKNAAE